VSSGSLAKPKSAPKEPKEEFTQALPTKEEQVKKTEKQIKSKMDDIKKSNKLQGTLKDHGVKDERRSACLAACGLIREQSDAEFISKNEELVNKLNDFVISQDKEIKASHKTLDERQLQAFKKARSIQLESTIKELEKASKTGRQVANQKIYTEIEAAFEQIKTAKDSSFKQDMIDRTGLLDQTPKAVADIVNLRKSFKESTAKRFDSLEEMCLKKKSQEQKSRDNALKSQTDALYTKLTSGKLKGHSATIQSIISRLQD